MRNASISDEGEFTCRAENEVGFMEQTGTLRVHSKFSCFYVWCVVYSHVRNILYTCTQSSILHLLTTILYMM